MIAAIHQPNFFPWLGFFKKIARCDVFVFLDAVPISRGSWTNRVKMIVSGEPRWVTCPVKWALGTNICDTRIQDKEPWRTKLVKTLEINYRKAPFFSRLICELAPLVENDEDNLAEFNIAGITTIARLLGLGCRFEKQSAMSAPAVFETRGSVRLTTICREVGATTYLAGDGAGGYEDASLYKSAGIRLVFNRFEPFVYPQVGSDAFAPGLSVLDALLNIGPAETSRLLRAYE
jgi:hypothetical protein